MRVNTKSGISRESSITQKVHFCATLKALTVKLRGDNADRHTFLYFLPIVIQNIINQNIMTLKEIYKKEKGMTILNITTVLVGIL